LLQTLEDLRRVGIPGGPDRLRNIFMPRKGDRKSSRYGTCSLTTPMGRSRIAGDQRGVTVSVLAVALARRLVPARAVARGVRFKVIGAGPPGP